MYQFRHCHPCLGSTGIWAESIYCGFPLITWVAGAGRFHLLPELFKTPETKLLGDRLEWMSLNKEEFQKSKGVLENDRC